MINRLNLSMKFSLTALMLFALTLQSKAQLATSKIFADHMVLQRNKNVTVWGWSKPKDKVKVSFNGQIVSTKADDQGNWKVMLKPMKEGGPYVMDISAGKEDLQYADVMMGEVWLCSGQSNMELALRSAEGYNAEQKVASSENIRQFLVPRKMSIVPEKDMAGGEWIKAAPGTIGNFTAVGYYFAKQLSAKLHVTVGIVHSSWGGTQAEDWISKESALTSPELKDVFTKQPATWDAIKASVDTQIRHYAFHNGPAVNYTAEQLAAQPASFFDTWNYGGTGAWMWQRWSAFNGSGFMERKITLDSVNVVSPSTLKIGQTLDDVGIYVNGTAVFKGALSNGQQFKLPAGSWKAGDNSLLIELIASPRNTEWAGVGLNGDPRTMNVQFEDTTINMADSKWKLMADFSKPYKLDLMPNNTITTLYNGMISPITQLTMAGAIWYQGESNAGRAYEYRKILPLLITDWRNKWGTDFPFFTVQLPAFGPVQNSNQGSTWAELREAQAMSLKLPNTGMAVTFDLGDPNNLHPTAKRFVGYRVADAALNVVYHVPRIAGYPTFSTVDYNNGAATVSFTNADSGLIIKDKYGYLKGFELAGADHKFYYAQATLVGNKVKVCSKDVPQPAAVRYAWSDSPVEANLYNKEGLPAAPFRTDDWNTITRKNKLLNN